MERIVAGITHGFRHHRAELSPHAARLLLALILLVGLLAAGRLALVSYVTVAARQLQGLRGQLRDLQRVNATIEVRIAEQQSAPDLLMMALSTGMEPALRTEYVAR